MRKRRLQATLGAVMLAIAVIGLLAGLAIDTRRREGRLVLLMSEYDRALDRAEWAQQMAKSGYISSSQLAAVRADLARIEARFDEFRAQPPIRQAQLSAGPRRP